MNFSKILPPVWFLLSILVMMGLNKFFPWRQLFVAPINYLGIVAIVSGIIISLSCTYQFRQKETTIKPFQESSYLVTDWLFSYSRNPIYSGMVIALFGVCIVLGNLTPFLVIPFFIWLIQEKFIKEEEKMLSEKFGEEYKVYQEKVRRWV